MSKHTTGNHVGPVRPGVPAARGTTLKLLEAGGRLNGCPPGEAGTTRKGFPRSRRIMGHFIFENGRITPAASERPTAMLVKPAARAMCSLRYVLSAEFADIGSILNIQHDSPRPRAPRPLASAGLGSSPWLRSGGPTSEVQRAARASVKAESDRDIATRGARRRRDPQNGSILNSNTLVQRHRLVLSLQVPKAVTRAALVCIPACKAQNRTTR